MKQKHLLITIAMALMCSVTASAADYNMEEGDNHVVNVAETFYLYDNGGPSGNVTPGKKYSVVLVPAVADKAVKINAVEFAVSGNRLMVYSGREAVADNLFNAPNGYFVSTGPKDIVSEAEDGSMLIRFSGSKDYSKGTIGTTIKGFKIEVSLTDKPVKQEEPMQGTYRVGASADARFRNLTELQAAMAVGLAGPTVIELEDGVYDESLLIKDLPGVSATNTLTITSVTGKPDACVITGPVTPLDNQGILCIDGTPYVTVKNITVATNEGNGSRYPYAGLHLRNGSHDCTVTGCVLTSPVSTLEADNRTYVLLANAGAAEGSACNRLTIADNRISGGYTGIYVGVDPAQEDYPPTGPATEGLTISGNTLEEVAKKGIELYTCTGFNVSGNSIVPGSGARKGGYMIDVWKPSGAFAITANRLLIEQSGDATGINLRTGDGSTDAATPALIANNVVAMPKAANAYTYGISINASVRNLIVAHNSINIKTSATNLNAIYGLYLSGTAPADGAPQILNNIVRTGASGVPLNASDALYTAATFGHNVLFSTKGLADSKKDFAAYQTASGDDSSVWLEADFLSDSDLHLNTVDRSMFMPRLAAVTTDYAGTARTELTTAGAYEYEIPAPDAPEIADGYPAVGTPTAKGVEIKTRWTIGGKLYVKAVPAADEAPTAEALKAGTATEIEADKEVVTSLTGLQPTTEYRAYCLVVSALGAESAIVPTATFTTLEDIQPLEASIFWQDEPFDAGQTVELEAYVEGGKEPYTYSWTDHAGNEVSTTATYSYTADVSRSFHLTVRSSDGQAVICKDDIPVITATLLPATFEDLGLAAESNWWCDELLSDGGLYNDTFFSGSFSFPNFSMLDYQYWGGYGYSNETATDFSTLDHQMRNAVGGGAAGTATYGVCYAYGSPTEMTIYVPETGVEVPGLYLTNSAYTLSSIANGDSYCPKFETGDYQEIVFEGKLGETSTGTVTVALADFRKDTPEILTEWTYVDLSSLGKITSLNFTLNGNKSAKVPAYVCLDEIGATNPNAGIVGLQTAPTAVITLAAADCLSVLGIEGEAILRIYSVDGRCRAEHRISGASTVSIADLPAGAYIATVDGAHPYRFAK